MYDQTLGSFIIILLKYERHLGLSQILILRYCLKAKNEKKKKDYCEPPEIFSLIDILFPFEFSINLMKAGISHPK